VTTIFDFFGCNAYNIVLITDVTQIIIEIRCRASGTQFFRYFIATEMTLLRSYSSLKKGGISVAEGVLRLSSAIGATFFFA